MMRTIVRRLAKAVRTRHRCSGGGRAYRSSEELADHAT